MIINLLVCINELINNRHKKLLNFVKEIDFIFSLQIILEKTELSNVPFILPYYIWAGVGGPRGYYYQGIFKLRLGASITSLVGLLVSWSVGRSSTQN